MEFTILGALIALAGVGVGVYLAKRSIPAIVVERNTTIDISELIDDIVDEVIDKLECDEAPDVVLDEVEVGGTE